MRIFYWYSQRGNFGDELNLWLWPRLWSEHDWTPGPSEGNEEEWTDETLFVGIGTVLTRMLPVRPQKIIFGAGTRAVRQAIPDESWRIYCVRGPMTAQALGLDPKTAITDAAALTTILPFSDATMRHEFSFMPHYYTDRTAMRQLCARLGIHYISPSNQVENILEDIRSSKVLLSEAMHGAIIADAFRVPWIPVVTNRAPPEFKWQDWCASLELEYEAHRLRPVWNLPDRPTFASRAKSFLRTKMAIQDFDHLRCHVRPTLSSEKCTARKNSAAEGKI